jgi:hypothetical protein
MPPHRTEFLSVAKIHSFYSSGVESGAGKVLDVEYVRYSKTSLRRDLDHPGSPPRLASGQMKAHR